MSKIGKLTQAIKILKKKPHLINQIIDHDSVYYDLVNTKYGLNNGLPVIEYPDIVKESKLSEYLFLDGGSLITDLLLLQSLAKEIDNCNYFEIGTWRGESCSAVALHTDKCFTFNLSNDQIAQLGNDQAYLNQIELLSKNNPAIKHVKGDSLKFDFKQLDIEPNLVFIDGDHHYEAVKSDSAKIFDWINPEKATIVWHDYGNSPEKPRWSVLAGILDGIPPSEHQYLYQVGNTKCAIYSRKDYPSKIQNWPQSPGMTFEIDLKMKPLI